MTVRNLSPQQMFIRLAEDHVPEHRFQGKNKKQFTSWKRRAEPKVLATLGDFPDGVPPKPELLAEWEEKGLRRQRWIIDVQKHLSATLLVNYPTDMKRGEKRPAILCCHGHGPYGKEPVMGNDSSPALRDNMVHHQYNYGQIMAQQGFITYEIGRAHV